MRACPALQLAVSAVASMVDCVGCVVVAVVASVVAVATHLEDTLPLAAASRTRISTTFLARISRQEQEEGIPRDTREDIQGQGAVAILAAGMAYEVELSRQIMVRNVSRPILASL